MLTGADLGRAIDAARIAKGLSRADLARAFGVRPQSVQDWLRRGTVDRDRLIRLLEFFADVVPPSHWGLPAEATPLLAILQPPGENLAAAVQALGHALMRLAPSQREALAVNLAAWAREGGAPHYNAAITALLASTGKQPRAA